MNADLKLSLFERKKEVLLFALFLMSVLLSNLGYQYHLYHKAVENKFFHTTATVTNQYTKTSKHGKTYHVLKLKSDAGYQFITTNYEDIKNLIQRKVRIGIITDKITFLDFLKSFYAPSFDIELLAYHDSVKKELQTYITSQHDNEREQALFSALFLASPIPKSLREKVSMLGISHLIAISGYHLGFLFGLLYLLFSKPYTFLQDRYFPYRNRKFDLSVFIIMILYLYVWMLDFTPALIRSFVMLAFGFLLYHRHIRILSFEVLAVAVGLIIALKPALFFSIGFWFSVSGIFYIYLFLHYFKDLHNWQIFILINFWVYAAMLPIVHTIFTSFSYWQLGSPFLSMLFALFYPLEMLLHIVGLGGALDPWLEKLFALSGQTIAWKTPLWFLIVYIALSILAIFDKRFLWLLLLLFLLFILII